MTEIKVNRKRIFKNTVYLYLRMILSMIIALYTSRVVLNQLGVNDYGIYGLVGGIVTIFSFLNGAMSSATSRFLNIEMSSGSARRILYTFNIALRIHIIIAIIVLILAESIGLWFVTNKLNIDHTRGAAAIWVFQFSVISSLISITQVPYNAALIAHERMDISAKLDILSSILKLGVALLLFLPIKNKLIFYAGALLGVYILVMSFYRMFCVKHYPECRFKFVWLPSIGKQMLSFSGWNLYSSFCFVGRQQGTNILLNIFGGTAINAAASLAATIQSLIDQVSNNLVLASRPQIISQYAYGKYKEMFRLMLDTNLLANVLYLLVAIPFISEIEFILQIWLKLIPPYLVPFSILTIIIGFVNLNNSILIIGVHASGRIKPYTIFAGSSSLLLLPILWLLFHFKFDLTWAYILPITILPLMYLICLFSLKKSISSFNPFKYVGKLIYKTISIIILPAFAVFLIRYFVSASFGRALLSISTAILLVIGSSYSFVLSKENKNIIKHKLKLHRNNVEFFKKI